MGARTACAGHFAIDPEFEPARKAGARLAGGQQAFGGRQFEDVDVIVQLPAMGARTLAQFAFGFGQGDVQRALAGLGASQQELQSDGGFAGTGFTLQQKYMTTGQAPGEDVIETLDTGGSFGIDQLVRCRQKMPSGGSNSEATDPIGLVGVPFHLTIGRDERSTVSCLFIDPVATPGRPD